MAFSIDDVRETFNTDMLALLNRIDGAAAEFLRLPMARPEPSVRGPKSLLEEIEAAAHAIAGTSGLVAAESLARTSKLFESLAAQGALELRQADQKIARVRRIAELFAGSSVPMRTMIALELEHRGGEAIRLVEDIEAGAEEVLRDVPEPMNSSGWGENAEEEPLEFSFEEGESPSPESPRSSANDDFGDELSAIFQDEAREALATLEPLLRSLASDPRDRKNAEHVERIFHTMKGAAAIVGLVEVSERAAELQHRLEAFLESSDSFSAPFHAEIVARTNELLEGVRLPKLNLKPLPSPAVPITAAPDVKQAFLREVAEVMEAARRLTTRLITADQFDDSPAELAGLFHRLKGSALLVGEASVADEAGLIQTLAGELEQPPFEVSSIVAALDKIESLMQIPPPSSRRWDAVTPQSERSTRQEVRPPSDAELWQAFEEECFELLESLDRLILTLEQSGQPQQSLAAILRHAHTLKGALYTIGLGPTGRLLHEVETLLESLLEATLLPPLKQLAGALLDVQAVVRRHLKTAPQGYVELELEPWQRRLALLQRGGPDARIRAQGRVSGTSHSGQSSSLDSSARLDRSLGGTGGTGRSFEETDNASNVESRGEAPERRFIRVPTERLDQLMNLAGELVVSRSRLAIRVEAMRGAQTELGTSRRRLLERIDQFRRENEFMRIPAGPGGESDVYPTFAVPKTPKTKFEKALPQDQNGADIAGPTSFFGLFGELELDRYEGVQILSRRLTEIANDFDETHAYLGRELAGFSDDSEAFSSTVHELQAEITRARMVPLEALFTRLRLPVRDAAEREDREVEVTTTGEDVNLDKTLADSLFQPMLHLVRNAVVHGIESAEQRQRIGKPRRGTIKLHARQQSGLIVLEVRDDGGGLDLEALHARGVQMGLIPPETPINDPSVVDLVFAPGLSTKAAVSRVAGRGIGCDVVRRDIERLNGTVRVESIRRAGTTFVITLPLTLAITRALLVKSAGRPYAIPLYFAERILDFEAAEVVESAGIRRIRLEENFVGLRRFNDLIGSGRSEVPNGPVLVLRVGDQRTCIQVDQVLGQAEIVVKSLGELLAAHPVFAGVTIRGDGELMLIIDVPSLIEARNAPRTARREEFEDDAGLTIQESTIEHRWKELRAERSMTASVPQKIRVLFVDDSLSVRKVAQRILAALGTDVTLAVDGLDALAKLRTGGFDLVFTDLEMPRMHGYDLIRELRFLPVYKTLPIIVVSSRSGQKHQDQARQLGATAYLTKPFSEQTILEALTRWNPPFAAMHRANHSVTQPQDENGSR